jgi:hypothetical protein
VLKPEVLQLFLLIIACLVSNSGRVGAQSVSSPYSVFGIGEITEHTLSRYYAMGSIGIGSSHSSSVNLLNPASYSDLVFTTIDAAGYYKYTRLKSSSRQTFLSSSGLQGISFVFPTRYLAIAFGITPYSSIGYQVVQSSTLENQGQELRIQTARQGEGGLNDFFVGTSFRIKRRLNVGMNLSYLFGTAVHYRTSSMFSNITTIQDQYTIGGLSFRWGTQYADTLKKSRWVYRIGLAGTIQTNLRTDRTQSLRVIDANRLLLLDTLIEKTNDNGVVIPAEIGWGVSIEKPGKYYWGIDYQQQNWANFRFSDYSENLALQYRVGIGGEYIPDLGSRQYLRSMAYRAGIRFEQTPIRIGNHVLRTTVFTFGLGLPIPRALSRVNIGFEAGMRGTTENGLLQESGFKVVVGLNFNERWFIRRKIE